MPPQERPSAFGKGKKEGEALNQMGGMTQNFLSEPRSSGRREVIVEA